MGNKNSAAQAQETQQSDDENSPSSNKSGVYLAQPFQEELVQTFQSKAIQNQFELFQAKMISSHNETISQDDQRRHALHRELTKWRDHNAQVQSSLDERMDAARAKFSDTEVGLRYDLGKMEETIKNKVPKFGNTANACLDSRAELTRCYNGVNDVRKCDGFVEAYERCAKQTVMSS